jgi:hypothetical protein
LGLRHSFTERFPKDFPFFRVNHQVIDRFRILQIFTGGIEKSDPAPFVGMDYPW